MYLFLVFFGVGITEGVERGGLEDPLAIAEFGEARYPVDLFHKVLEVDEGEDVAAEGGFYEVKYDEDEEGGGGTDEETTNEESAIADSIWGFGCVGLVEFWEVGRDFFWFFILAKALECVKLGDGADDSGGEFAFGDRLRDIIKEADFAHCVKEEVGIEIGRHEDAAEEGPAVFGASEEHEAGLVADVVGAEEDFDGVSVEDLLCFGGSGDGEEGAVWAEGGGEGISGGGVGVEEKDLRRHCARDCNLSCDERGKAKFGLAE